MPNIELTKTLVALAQIKLLAEGTRNLGTAAVQRRLHDEFAGRRINADQLRRLQSEWNGVQDHLDLFISELSAIHDELLPPEVEPEPHGSRDTFVPHPTNPQPDYCEACGNALRLDAECRCGGCGNG